VRFFAVRGTYLIVYDPASEPLEVLRLLHGSRDVTAQLAKGES
jgi:plasmid stabilization system protein ParE